MPAYDPDFSDHECVVEELYGEFLMTCVCGHREWHRDAERVEMAVEDHQSGRKRRRHAPLDRKARDRVLALAAAPPVPQAGVLFSCRCYTWNGTFRKILYRGSHATMKRKCFVCGGKKIREPETATA